VNSPNGNFCSSVIAGNTGSNLLYGFMLWSTAGGEHVLIGRRIVEMNIYANGIYEAKAHYDVASRPSRYRIAFMNPNGGTVRYDEHGFDTEDPIPIKTVITGAPSGPDETGALVTYVLDGWYTERIGGTKVEVLDESIATGTVLYAHWKTPSGTPVVIPPANTGWKLTVQVTGDGVNIRSGPQTYYLSVGKANKGDQIEITEVARGGGLLWGRSGDQWICLKYTDYDAILKKLLPMWGKVTANTLNVRKDAGTNYALVEGATKKNGDIILVREWKTDGTMMWGRIDEGWVALPYVTFENVNVTDETVQSIEITQMPGKLTYIHGVEELDITGGKLLVSFVKGGSQTVDMTPEMVTGFDNKIFGTNTLTVTYKEATATFQVEVIKAKVVFKMDDGSVISEGEYLFGDEIAVPEVPTKPTDENGYYVFIGWDTEVAPTCQGNAVYTAQFQQKELVGDVNRDTFVNDRDVIYLLGHTLFPEDFPITGTADMNGDGSINDRDAIYLLGYTLFPEDFPLAH